MQALVIFYGMYPFWVWLAVGALLLACEVATGSGYLLWPAACAAAVGLLAFAVRPGLPVELGVFAVLTIVTTYLARRYLPPSGHKHGEDINDRAGRLVGSFGECVGLFASGQGRVFVDGAEWSAELPADQPVPQPGARVQVISVVGGGRLRVKPV